VQLVYTCPGPPDLPAAGTRRPLSHRLGAHAMPTPRSTPRLPPTAAAAVNLAALLLSLTLFPRRATAAAPAIVSVSPDRSINVWPGEKLVVGSRQKLLKSSSNTFANQCALSSNDTRVDGCVFSAEPLAGGDGRGPCRGCGETNRHCRYILGQERGQERVGGADAHEAAAAGKASACMLS